MSSPKPKDSVPLDSGKEYNKGRFIFANNILSRKKKNLRSHEKQVCLCHAINEPKDEHKCPNGTIYTNNYLFEGLVDQL